MTNIYEYLDYRQYLKDMVEEKRATGRPFSMRQFSKAAGFSSSGYLAMVIDGKRNLTPAPIRKFCKGLKLKKHEAEFFENLVLMNQAKTHEEKNHYYQRLASSRRYLEIKHLEHAQYEFFSKWYHAAIWEMMAFPHFRNAPAWIAGQLTPRVTAKEAAETIELLIKLGMVNCDAAGTLSRIDPHVGTPDEIASLALANFHREMIQRAKESIDLHAAANREISSLTVAMSQEKFAQAKRMIQEFRKHLGALLSEEDAPDAIYQINMQMFKLAGEDA